MISNCSVNESGKVSGGKAGDQTGREYRVCAWYMHPHRWTHILRYPDKKVRETIATLAEEAAENDRIGYAQDNRLTFWMQLQKVGYHPAAITKACEADCSSSTAAIVKATGYLLNNKALQGVSTCLTTKNMRTVLKSAGFKVLTDNIYLGSEDSLKRGDIILSENHHVCINLTKGKNVQKQETAITLTDIAKEVVAGKWGSGLERKTKLIAAGYNYTEIQTLVNKLLKGVKL